MKKLTLEQVILDAHQLWDHIAETGDGKSQATSYLVDDKGQTHLEYLGIGNSYCPFCAYSDDIEGTSKHFCDDCPASGMWVEDDHTATCEDMDAPYNSNVMMFGHASEIRKVGAEMTILIKKVADKHNVNL